MSNENAENPQFKQCLSNMVYIEMNGELTKHGKFLIGKILTVIDASVADPEQRKALKDVFKEMWDTHYFSPLHKMAIAFHETLGDILDEFNPQDDKSHLTTCAPNHPYIYIEPQKLDYEYSRKEK